MCLIKSRDSDSRDRCSGSSRSMILNYYPMLASDSFMKLLVLENFWVCPVELL
jgi:hypothetical protein